MDGLLTSDFARSTIRPVLFNNVEIEMTKTTTTLTVADYSKNYGGLDIMIDGRECSICSVVGYALYNKEDPVEAVLDTLCKMKEFPGNGYEMVWINLKGTMITSSKAYYEKLNAARAAMPKLSTGDLIEFEGKVYEIIPANNRNFGLKPVAALLRRSE